MKPAKEYLIEDRKLDPAVVEYAAWRTSQREYIIPYFDALGRERTQRFHRPNDKPKYRSLPGSQAHLYCVENVRFGTVVLCEGEIDTLTALSVGVKAVGVAGANSFFRPWAHLLDHTDRLIIAFDGDYAGRQAAAKLKSALNHATILELPDGLDLNDVMCNDGPNAVKELLDV